VFFESTRLLGDFNARVEYNAGLWKGVIGRHGDVDVYDYGKLLLQLCCDNGA